MKLDGKLKQILLHPNSLTLFRIFSVPIIVLLMIYPNRLFTAAAALIFSAAAITDYLDGYLARQYGLESTLGKVMDPVVAHGVKLVSIGLFVDPDAALVAEHVEFAEAIAEVDHAGGHGTAQLGEDRERVELQPVGVGSIHAPTVDRGGAPSQVVAGAGERGSASAGRTTVILAPSPGRLSISRRPPWRSTMPSRTSARSSGGATCWTRRAGKSTSKAASLCPRRPTRTTRWRWMRTGEN